jgi:hypothetical protein
VKFTSLPARDKRLFWLMSSRRTILLAARMIEGDGGVHQHEGEHEAVLPDDDGDVEFALAGFLAVMDGVDHDPDDDATAGDEDGPETDEDGETDRFSGSS